MLIIDDELNRKIKCVTILLTKDELKQLLGYTEQLLEKSPGSDHYHLSSEDYQKEITICMYDPEKTEEFHPSIRKIIKEDTER